MFVLSKITVPPVAVVSAAVRVTEPILLYAPPLSERQTVKLCSLLEASVHVSVIRVGFVFIAACKLVGAVGYITVTVFDGIDEPTALTAVT